MFIDLIETLRCPRSHEDSWLVGAFDELSDRDVRTGRLGCPVCRAEYPILGGVVYFDPPSEEDFGNLEPSDLGADAALRLAAMLDLASPGGLVVLHGQWGRAGSMLAGFVESQLLLLDPPSGVAERERLSAVVCRNAVPVAAGSCRAMAIHDTGAVERRASSIASALRTRGRLVIPSAAALPEGFDVLARDASWVVGERSVAPSGLVSLGSARRR